ncbi:MAG: UDP-N-acetylmuramate dehydrogenase [Alphaproteobacteria bacterium]|nr:MAG: UDP-N-acetylmuramate dehydrogenase [Alphaproteobacteria bacterium]TAF41649.1 MAG: UDP-N-acetylmuramate dehydrogenase [Alphaproteobacteria bacterium]TAF76495.1 MAG: UDP-N-acetylmuramate dehydrogenase [Alphaproteobacteria bacterium]
MMQLQDHLPKVRGRLRFDVPLASRCWFAVGGNADCVFTPEDTQDLSDFLAQLPSHIPVMVMGVASNMLVRDGGIEGVVIRLGRDAAQVTHEGDMLCAGGAVLDAHVARYAADAGIAGLEFLVGIPGTMGGAVQMNAGAYGGDMAGCVVRIEAVDRAGAIHHVGAEAIGFRYRSSTLPKDWMITRVWVRGGAGHDPATIHAHMEDIMRSREATQPVRSKTGGSTFKNPEGYKAWELIDAAGCRGLTHGDAQISLMHCNFMINHGKASANDLESLGEEVRRRVLETSGVMLEWEIKRVGRVRDTVE